MASVAFQLIEEVTAHAQSDSLEDAREICADGTYFPKNVRTVLYKVIIKFRYFFRNYFCHLDINLPSSGDVVSLI